MLTVEQISKEAGVHPRTVQHWIRAGRLKATKPVQRWWIEEKDWEKFKKGGA